MPPSAEPQARVVEDAAVTSSPSTFAAIEKLYAWMQASIINGEEAQKLDEALAKEIRPNSRQSAHRRMEIYSSDFFGRFRSVMAVDYPAVEFAMGGKGWNTLADAFVRAMPSRSPEINTYGYELPEFLKGYDTPHQAFLADLAKLQMEVARRYLWDDGAPIDSMLIQAMPPEQWESVNLVPRSSVDSFAFSYDVNGYVNDFVADEEPMIPEKPVKQWVQVYRVGDEVWRQDISEARHHALQALKRGEVISEALALASSFFNREEKKNVSDVIQSWFADWMEDGVFESINRKRGG